MKITLEERDHIKNFLLKHLNPLLILMFGSAVEGNFREDSDIDLAFLTRKEVSDYEVFIFAQKLASLIGRDVDLINLRNASTVFKAQIVGNSEVLYSTDEYLEAEYKIRILKEYALLNEERAEILNRIKKEGKVL